MIRLVAVHGNGGGSTRFSRLVGRFPDGIALDAVDLPGFNGVPIDPELRTVPDYADRLGEHLTSDDSIAGRPVVLGHGIGGSIALDLASRRPELFAGLVLHAPVGADLDSRLFPRIMSTRPMRELVRRAIAARVLRPVWRRVFFPTGAPRSVLDDFFEGYRTCEAFGQMFDIIDADWFQGLQPVADVRTCLLWGEHDRVLRAAQTDAIRSKVPGAELRIEAGWDHFPMIEQPEEYARVVASIAQDLANPPV